MKKVLFDGTAMQSDDKIKFHGGSEYAKYVFKEALKAGYEFDIVLDKKKYLDENIMTLIDNYKVNIIYIQNKKDLYDLIDKNNYTIFYTALPYDYYDYNSSATLKGVIHGLREIELPWDDFKHKYYEKKTKRILGWIVNKSNWIQKKLLKKHIEKFNKLIEIPHSRFITVSNHSKYSLLNFFPKVEESKVKVFYSPYEYAEKTEMEPKLNEKYFLLVSGNRFEKNTYRAIKAFDSLFSQKRLQDFTVVITGAKDLPFRDEIKNKDKFHLMSYQSQEDLENLYQNAFCFVYPSLNEGFGYPPLVAMSMGIPVIASSSTSIPEVCGNAALYFSANNVDELKNRILQIINDENLKNNLIDNGYSQLKKIKEKQLQDMKLYLEYIFE